MRVIFFGTPAIAANILACLLKHNIDIVAVVTKPDKKQGRSQHLQPSAVKKWVLDQGLSIPILEPLKVSTSEYQEKLMQFQADLFVVVAYGEIVKQNILDIPKIGCINVHASLLPKYRGAAPMHRAIIQGEVESGVTIMEMVLALDAGAILHVEKTEIPEDMNVGELEIKIGHLGCIGLLKTFDKITKGALQKIPQDEQLVTYASKITPQECEIHWNRPAKEIHDLIRGVTPFPGAWCYIICDPQGKQEKKRLKIKKTIVVKNLLKNTPGNIVQYEKGVWLVATQEGSLQILEVQLEGKKTMSASEFIAGHRQPQLYI